MGRRKLLRNAPDYFPIFRDCEWKTAQPRATGCDQRYTKVHRNLEEAL
jgi:hypothetical protein